MAGMALVIDGAMQQAPHLRHSMTTSLEAVLSADNGTGIIRQQYTHFNP